MHHDPRPTQDISQGTSPLQPGPHPERLGRYRILGELGRGGMGIVLLGEDPDLQRPVAIKTLPPDLAENLESYARFQQEARLLAALNHPNVATIYSLEVIDGVPMLTMERIVGETLASRLRAGALSTDETLRIGTKIARAIEAAHERGVIHRDLKPGNVMLREDGEVKVLDFGLAKALPSGARARIDTTFDARTVSSTTPHSKPASAIVGPEDHHTAVTVVRSSPTPRSPLDTSRSGTIGYMSPEQILGLPIDERTDLFAFGTVLFECATGGRAFGGDTLSAVAEATVRDTALLDRLPAVLPRALHETIARCLAKEPGERPESALIVRKTLEEALERSLFAQLSENLRREDLDSKRENPNNLPHALTSFIGRGQELRAVPALLAEHSLVTLTGAGGAGKTRLAIEVARAFGRNGAPGGVWLVELAPLTDPALLEKTVMTAIGIPEQADRSARDAILDHFGPRSALLVLDNCEHLLETAASFVHVILQRCQGVRVLVTSREPLGLPGECRFVVPPLSSQDLSSDRPAEELRESEVVHLFMERARQVRPDLELTPNTLEAVVGICRRLDGLPLALELAASRVRVLEPDALLARLDDRFRILTGGSREKLPHQRTLLASIEWSHDQLDETERILFRRLGIFAGGFTLDSVESVCVDQDLEQWSVLDGLSSLIDKSLIEPAFHREDAARSAPRYRMLETFRQYAKQQSEAAGDWEAIKDRFVRYWMEVAKHAAANLNSPEAKGILARLDLELGNLREAIRIALSEMDDSQVALVLTGNLVRYWMLRTHWSEGLEFLRRALERPGAGARTVGRATALNASGTLEYLTGRYAKSIGHLEEAIGIFTELGMRKEAARGRTNLGNAYTYTAQYQDALREHEAVLATAREMADDWLTGAALVNICNVSEAMGNLARVEDAALEAVVLMERVGDRTNLLMAYNWVGAAAYRQNQYDEGIVFFTKGLAIALEHDDQYNVGLQRLHRGLCLTGLERHDEALEDYRAALEIAHEFKEPSLLTAAVEAFAHSANLRGALAEAAAFVSLADRLRSDHALPSRDINARDVENLRTLLRDALGNEGYARMEAEGRAMTVEEMIAQVGTRTG